MFVPTRGRLLSAALFALAWAGASVAACAEIAEYEFQLIEPELKQGEATLAVRLVHKPTGNAVSDAVIFARRLDMAPDGMPTMTTPLEQLPPAEPGVYRFRTNLTMEGGWRLSLAAKVQGEAETLEARLDLKAVQ
jgi:hypothetical protein